MVVLLFLFIASPLFSARWRVVWYLWFLHQSFWTGPRYPHWASGSLNLLPPLLLLPAFSSHCNRCLEPRLLWGSWCLWRHVQVSYCTTTHRKFDTIVLLSSKCMVLSSKWMVLFFSRRYEIQLAITCTSTESEPIVVVLSFTKLPYFLRSFFRILSFHAKSQQIEGRNLHY